MKIEDIKRGAGILLHITSLPSPFGIGDMGPEAYNFADFLCKCNQKYWQILPLNPTEAQNGYSPYSSYAALGGNTMLISPELLAQEGLLTTQELQQYVLPQEDKANFTKGCKIKEKLLEKAYHNFITKNDASLNGSFDNFCKEEAYWLEDFSLFMLLKEKYESKPWYEWPEEYKLRNETALKNISDQNADYIKKIKWLQFMFCRQWQELKKYCNKNNIKIFGDMPFYVSYDSADVWADPDVFSLDEKGNITKVAGVPPDYFSEDGQLWGMPTYKWDVIKKQDYKWWVNRLHKNLQLYDLLRIDHFRAFQDYWEVDAGEKTAKKGTWLPGPGTEFFEKMRAELGDLPIVAEDLGYEMDAVYKLRDDVNLPGMKVLQFAFAENMPKSVDIPHNYTSYCIVYTGTHDNNTTIGWYRSEAKPEDLERLEKYLGYTIQDKNVHIALSRMAYASVAFIAILPMQDIIGLGEDKRMNTPGSSDNNWQWRLLPEQINEEIENRLKEWVTIYNR